MVRTDLSLGFSGGDKHVRSRKEKIIGDDRISGIASRQGNVDTANAGILDIP